MGPLPHTQTHTPSARPVRPRFPILGVGGALARPQPSELQPRNPPRPRANFPALPPELLQLVKKHCSSHQTHQNRALAYLCCPPSCSNSRQITSQDTRPAQTTRSSLDIAPLLPELAPNDVPGPQTCSNRPQLPRHCSAPDRTRAKSRPRTPNLLKPPTAP